MKLPIEIFNEMLDLIAMPRLDYSTARTYGHRLRAMRKEMRELSADFAAGKPSEARYSDAYLLYNFPMNLAKTAHVTEKIRLYYPELLAGRERFDVIDVGCGSGAGVFGFYYAFSDVPGIRQFNFTGIDSSHRMLAQAQHLARWLATRDRRVRVRFVKRKVENLYSLHGKKKYDLILFVNSLAEMAKDNNDTLRLTHSVLSCLTESGLLVLIEPALKKISRRLMVLHDRLASDTRAQILLPCLCDDPCALLQVDHRTEWCHQNVAWTPPDFLRVINQGIDREIDVLKFSYLVVARTSKRLKRPRGYMVISNLLREKGKRRCFICTAGGRVELVRLDKAASEKNARFSDIEKGLIVKLADIVRKKEDYWQVTEDSTVRIVK